MTLLYFDQKMKSEFTSSWLHGVSERHQSGSLPKTIFDALITASSWDRRCLSITREGNITADTAVMIDFSTRDDQGLRDSHDPLLEAYVREKSRHFVKLKGSSAVVEELWAELKQALILIADRLERPISICIDISTFPRFLTGAVLALGLKQGLASSITAFYSEGVYENPGDDLQGVFTGERWRFVPINGLEGNYDSTKNRFFLLSVGFEGSKTLRYLATQEPDRVSVLFADPGFEPSYPGKSRANNAPLIEYFHIPDDQMAAAHAGDSIAAWQELTKRKFERFGKENVSYLCCGTKPHSFALMLRALCVSSATVLYNVPDIHRVIKTIPNGRVWTYTINDITRL